MARTRTTTQENFDLARELEKLQCAVWGSFSTRRLPTNAKWVFKILEIRKGFLVNLSLLLGSLKVLGYFEDLALLCSRLFIPSQVFFMLEKLFSKNVT